MNDHEYAKYQGIFLLLPVIILAIESFGIRDLSDRSFSGYTADENNVIVSVVPGSPADRAGIRAGDRMTLQAGVDARDAGSLLRLPRPAIGETRTYVLERNDSTVRAHITFTGLPPGEVNESILYAVLGFSFLAVGLWAYFRRPARESVLLALVCFSAAIDFIHHPYIPSFELRLAYMLALNMTVFFGYAVLLHLVLVFPAPPSVLVDRPLIRAAVYAPAALLTLMFLAVVVSGTAGGGGLMTAAYAFYAVFFIGYLGAVIAVLIRRYVQSPPRERMASGLNVILFGAVAGVVPSIVAGVMRRLAPSVTLPGSEYYIVAVILIPLSFVIAMTKKPVRPAP